VDVRIPRPERRFGVLVAGRLPELLQASLGDDPHPLPLVAASEGIVVRKTRTIKAKVRETRTALPEVNDVMTPIGSRFIAAAQPAWPVVFSIADSNAPQNR